MAMGGTIKGIRCINCKSVINSTEYYFTYKSCRKCGIGIDLNKGIRKKCLGCKCDKLIEDFNTGLKQCKKCRISRNKYKSKKIECECGSIYRSGGKDDHLMTTKHFNWVKK